MLDEKLKEEFKKEEEKKGGAGKQFNETVASSEVGAGPRSWSNPAAEGQIGCRCGCLRCNGCDRY